MSEEIEARLAACALRGRAGDDDMAWLLSFARELQAENEKLRSDNGRGQTLIFAFRARAIAAESREKELRAGLQAIIDYVPPGFVSPMDDEDSMNYRAIALAVLEEKP